VTTLSFQARRGHQGGVTLDPSGVYDFVLDRTDFGAFAPDAQLVTRQQDGYSTLTGTTVKPRTIMLGIDAFGPDHATAAAAVQAVIDEAQDCSRSGGTLRWVKTGASYPVYFRVLHAVYHVPVDFWFDAKQRAMGTLELLVDPLALGDPMGFLDTFSVDNGPSSASPAWAAVQNGSAHQVTRDRLRPVNTATQCRWGRSDRGYAYTDVQLTVGWKAGAASSTSDVRVGIGDNANSNTYILARSYDNAGTRTLAIIAATVPDGGGTLASLAISAITADQQYWLRFRREGMLVTAEWFAQNSEPTLADTPTSSVRVALDVTTTIAAGQIVSGSPQFGATSSNANDEYGPFRCEPFVYVIDRPPGIVTLPYIPGDSPALASIEFSAPSAGTVQNFGAAWWCPAQAKTNLCWNALGEAGGVLSSTTTGWSVAGANQFGTATQIVLDTSAFSKGWGGTASFRTDLYTNSQSGAFFRVWRRARRGQPLVMAGVWSVAGGGGTVPMRHILGPESNDAARIAMGTLSGSWANFANYYIGTADYPVWSFGWANNVATGTAQTVYTDQLCAGEAPFVTTWASGGTVSASFASGTVASQPPAGWPATPFYIAGISSGRLTVEIMKVTAVTGGTVLALERAVNSSADNLVRVASSASGTVATLTYKDPVVVLPRLWGREGVHATPTDILGLARPAAAASATPEATVTGGGASTTTGAHGTVGSNGYGLQTTSSIATGVYYIDQNAVSLPREAANDDIVSECWPRLLLNGSATLPTVMLQTAYEEGAGYRPGLENGTAGYALPLPNATSLVWRRHRVDSVAMRLDDSPTAPRSGLLVQLSTGNGTAIYADDMILAHSQRLASPTGVPATANLYPPFLDTGAASGTRTRRVEHDLATGVGSTRGRFGAAGGIIGDAVVLHAPSSDLVVTAETTVPNDATVTSTQGGFPSTLVVAVNVTPRYAVVR
jgi:hypothetical protein